MSRISPAMMAATKWWFSGLGRFSGFAAIGDYVDRTKQVQYTAEQAPFEIPVLVDVKAVRTAGLSKALRCLRLQATDWPVFSDNIGEGMPAMYWIQVALVPAHIAAEMQGDDARYLNLEELIALALMHPEKLQGIYVAQGSFSQLCSTEHPAFVMYASSEETRGGGEFTWGVPAEMHGEVFVPLCRKDL